MSNFYTEYAEFTTTTARYPVALEKPYLALGLVDETADELMSAFYNLDAPNMFLELGDGQWYACRLCGAFGFDFAEIVAAAKTARGEHRTLDLKSSIIELSRYAAKVAGRVKKHARDGDQWGEVQLADFRTILRFYLTRYVVLSFLVIDNIWKLDNHTGNYDDCLSANAKKLGHRLARGVIQGEGDFR